MSPAPPASKPEHTAANPSMAFPVTGVILAAGSSRRFGNNDKLTAEHEGTPIILKTLRALIASRCNGVIVVVAPDNRPVMDLLNDQPVTGVINHKADQGLGSSIAAGISSLPPDTNGALILPGDMPWMTPAFIDRLIEAFQTGLGKKVVIPVTPTGEQRNPLIWPSSYFAQIRSLTGDRGAKQLIPADRDQKVEVRADDPRLFRDIDTPNDLAT